jgi:hypothetical protein
MLAGAGMQTEGGGLLPPPPSRHTRCWRGRERRQGPGSAMVWALQRVVPWKLLLDRLQCCAATSAPPPPPTHTHLVEPLGRLLRQNVGRHLADVELPVRGLHRLALAEGVLLHLCRAWQRSAGRACQAGLRSRR